MQINFTGHQIEITPALRAFAEEKLQRLKDHFERITSIHITFDVQKMSQAVEATIYVAKGEIHAHAESEDMYASIDTLIDKLNVQLMKHKEKHLDHRDHRDHKSNREWDE